MGNLQAYGQLNRQFINGLWLDGGEKTIIENKNPFSGQVIHTLPSAGLLDVDACFTAARFATRLWAESDPLFRRDLLLKAASLLVARRDELTKWLCDEAGSTFIKAIVEIQQVHNILVESASFPTRMHGLTSASTTQWKESFVFRKPLGVIGLISPWNFSLYLSMRTIAPALATGNTIVVKPSALSLVTGGTFIAKLLEEAGFPAGVFNVVVGDSSIIGDYFSGHPEANMISFTGSTPVGRQIGKIAGERLKKTALELGGNNAHIVLEDADVEYAVDAAVFGKFLHQGQMCISINRILVHESILEAFKTRFVERVKLLTVGDPANRDTIIGPLIGRSAVDRILEQVEASVKMGAVVETGIKVDGNLLYPAVLSGVTKEMPIFQDEIFGPAVGLATFADDDEMVELANATGFGLSGSLHTRDVYRGMSLARRITTGMVHVNDQTANDEIHMPFGGEKNSGMGRFGGTFILDELTTVQWVSVQAQNRKYPF
jgi:acyl-CoA reductase-like NAD-dependent aldehyde dehydrogenase